MLEHYGQSCVHLILLWDICQSCLCIYHFKIRHLGFFPRANGFFTSQHQYYPNATSNFQQIRHVTSGVVSLNPGPITRSQSAILTSTSESLYPHLCKLLTLKGLKIGHLNCNGLLGKLIEVKALVSTIQSTFWPLPRLLFGVLQMIWQLTFLAIK